MTTDPVCVNHLNIKTEDLVNSFWELENIPNVQILTAQEKLCENFLRVFIIGKKQAVTSVLLPFKQDRDILGDYRQMSHKRLLYLEKRLINIHARYFQRI